MASVAVMVNVNSPVFVGVPDNTPFVRFKPPGNVPLVTLEQLRGNRLISQAVPLAMGDNYRGFRIVGTEPEYLQSAFINGIKRVQCAW